MAAIKSVGVASAWCSTWKSSWMRILPGNKSKTSPNCDKVLTEIVGIEQKFSFACRRRDSYARISTAPKAVSYTEQTRVGKSIMRTGKSQGLVYTATLVFWDISWQFFFVFFTLKTSTRKVRNQVTWMWNFTGYTVPKHNFQDEIFCHHSDVRFQAQVTAYVLRHETTGDLNEEFYRTYNLQDEIFVQSLSGTFFSKLKSWLAIVVRAQNVPPTDTLRRLFLVSIFLSCVATSCLQFPNFGRMFGVLNRTGRRPPRHTCGVTNLQSNSVIPQDKRSPVVSQCLAAKLISFITRRGVHARFCDQKGNSHIRAEIKSRRMKHSSTVVGRHSALSALRTNLNICCLQCILCLVDNLVYLSTAFHRDCASYVHDVCSWQQKTFARSLLHSQANTVCSVVVAYCLWLLLVNTM